MSLAFPLTALLVTLSLGGWLFWLSMQRARVSEAKREEEEFARILRDFDAGLCNKEGNPLCQVCGAIATHHLPQVGRARFDDWGPIAWLNRLYALPWRYSVVIEEVGPPVVCKPHNTQAVEHAEHFIGTLRAEHVRFNAQAQDKVMAMNRVTLMQLLRADEDRYHLVIPVGGAPAQLQSAKDTVEL